MPWCLPSFLSKAISPGGDHRLSQPTKEQPHTRTGFQRLPDREDVGDTDPLWSHTALGKIKEMLCNGLLKKGRSFGNVSTSSLETPLNFQPHRWGSSSPLWALEIEIFLFQFTQTEPKLGMCISPKGHRAIFKIVKCTKVAWRDLSKDQSFASVS